MKTIFILMLACFSLQAQQDSVVIPQRVEFNGETYELEPSKNGVNYLLRDCTPTTMFVEADGVFRRVYIDKPTHAFPKGKPIVIDFFRGIPYKREFNLIK